VLCRGVKFSVGGFRTYITIIIKAIVLSILTITAVAVPNTTACAKSSELTKLWRKLSSWENNTFTLYLKVNKSRGVKQTEQVAR
jgi:hypothetical protein